MLCVNHRTALCSGADRAVVLIRSSYVVLFLFLKASNKYLDLMSTLSICGLKSFRLEFCFNRWTRSLSLSGGWSAPWQTCFKLACFDPRGSVRSRSWVMMKSKRDVKENRCRPAQLQRFEKACRWFPSLQAASGFPSFSSLGLSKWRHPPGGYDCFGFCIK